MSWFPWDILFRFPLAILLSVICSCLSLISGLCPWISTVPGGRWVEPCSMPQSRLEEQKFQSSVPGRWIRQGRSTLSVYTLQSSLCSLAAQISYSPVFKTLGTAGPGGRWAEPCSMPQSRRVETEVPKFCSWSLDQAGWSARFACALSRDLSVPCLPRSPTHHFLNT